MKKLIVLVSAVCLLALGAVDFAEACGTCGCSAKKACPMTTQQSSCSKKGNCPISTEKSKCDKKGCPIKAEQSKCLKKDGCPLK